MKIENRNITKLMTELNYMPLLQENEAFTNLIILSQMFWRITLIFLLMAESLRCTSQPAPDSIHFAKNSFCICGKIKSTLDQFGKRNRASDINLFFIVAYAKSEKGDQLSWDRGYAVYRYLIDSCGISKGRLSMKYGIAGDASLLMIVPSSLSELDGTNCGIPKMPLFDPTKCEPKRHKH